MRVRVLLSSLSALTCAIGCAIGAAAPSFAETAADVFSIPSTEPNISIPARSWIDNTTPPKVVLVCVHGLGLNSESYTDFAKRVAPKGVAVIAMDVRGFGEWQKEKGHSKIDFKQTVLDVANVLKYARSKYPDLPLFLLGESMGGAIVLRTTSLHQDLMDGTISSVPASERFQQKITDVKVALHALEGFRKKFNEGNQVIEQAAPNNKAERKGWETDPLDRLNFSPDDLLQFQLFCNENHDSAKDITKTPILVFQGGSDTLIKPNGTEHLFKDITVKDKILIVLGYSEHLMFEEAQYFDPTQAIDQLMAWIKDHNKVATKDTASKQAGD